MSRLLSSASGTGDSLIIEIADSLTTTSGSPDSGRVTGKAAS